MHVLHRKQIRLKGYDYCQNGAYFITICSFQRFSIFGEIIVGQELCSCQLSNTGYIIESEIIKLEEHFKGIEIDKYVVMPNHVHMIITIGAQRQEQSSCPTIGNVIQALKSRTTKQANQIETKPGRKIWQYRYYDHIIRNDHDYQLIWNYIDTNPLRWDKDKYYH